MIGVCDGHGVQGHLVSNFVKINLPKILQELILNQFPTQNNANNIYEDDMNKSQIIKSKERSFLPPLAAGKKNGKIFDYDDHSNALNYPTYNNDETLIQSENEQSSKKQSNVLSEFWFS